MLEVSCFRKARSLLSHAPVFALLDVLIVLTLRSAIKAEHSNFVGDFFVSIETANSGAASFDLVIIGTGLAGYGLARQFCKFKPEASVLMITSDDGR
ncbi:MAG: hypothetical protein AAF680_12880, partial [Pseudomonadota bacterium]